MSTGGIFTMLQGPPPRTLGEDLLAGLKNGKINIDGCDLGDEHLPALEAHPLSLEVRILSCCHNRFTRLPKTWSSLEHVSASSNCLIASLLPGINEWPLLSYIDVRCQAQPGFGNGADLPLWPALTHFVAYYAGLSGTLPCWPNLEYVACQYNKLTTLPNWPKVMHVRCSVNPLQEWPQWPLIKIIECCNMRTIVPPLQEWPTLEVLISDNNKFSGSLPCWPQLECFHGEHCELQTLPNWPQVRVVYCPFNQLQRLPYWPKLTILICLNNPVQVVPHWHNCSYMVDDMTWGTHVDHYVITKINHGNEIMFELSWSMANWLHNCNYATNVPTHISYKCRSAVYWAAKLRAVIRKWRRYVIEN